MGDSLSYFDNVLLDYYVITLLHVHVNPYSFSLLKLL